MANATYLLTLAIGGKTNPSYYSSLNKAQRRMNAFKGSMAGVATAITAAFAAVNVTQWVKDAIEEYEEFEQAMANTAAIADATVSEYERMEEAAREAGRTTTKSATDAADALGYMALAGWNTEDSLTGLMPILKLSEATQADLKTTSDLVTDSLTAMGIGVDDLDEYLDKLIAANNNANTTAEQLMESLTKTGGSAQMLGVSLDDAITATGILASSGIKAEEAGTSLNSILNRMGSNTTALKMFDKLGVSIFDDSGKFIGLKESLLAISDALDGASDEEKISALSALAGVRQASKLAYLLNSVGMDVPEGGLTEGEEWANGQASAWETLETAVENSDGALQKMNATATDTLQSAASRYTNAMNDLKIGTVDVFGDYAKDAINELAQFIPSITEKITEWGGEHQRELRELSQNIEEFIEGAINTVSDFVLFVAENGNTITGVLEGIAAYLVLKNVTNFLSGTAAGIETVVGAIKTMSATSNAAAISFSGALGIVGLIASAAVGIGVAVHGIIKEMREDELAKNLSEHFGSISLSLQEIETTAKHIIGTKILSQADAFEDQADAVDDINDEVSELNQTLRKAEWQIKAGIELDGTSAMELANNVDSFVAQAQEYAQNKKYEVTLALQLLYGDDSDEASNMTDALLAGANSIETELTELGQQMSDVVNAAFVDGVFDADLLDTEKLASIQRQIYEAQQKLAGAEWDAKMQTLGTKYGAGASLDSGSFFELEEELSEMTQAQQESFQNALTEVQKAYNLTVDEYGEYSDEGKEAKKALEAAQSEYLNSVSSMDSDVTEFLLESLDKVYGSELDEYLDYYKQQALNFFETTGKDMDPETLAVYTKVNDIRSDPGNILNQMLGTYDAGDVEAYKKIFEELQSQLDTLNALSAGYEEAGETVPDAIQNALYRIYEYGAMGGDDEAQAYILSHDFIDTSQIDIEGISGDMKDYGALATESFFSSAEDAVSAGAASLEETTSRELQEKFKNGWDINTALRLHADITLGNNKSYSTDGEGKAGYSVIGGNIASNATGGIYGHEILTTVAEEGPEAIIPLNRKPRSMSLLAEANRLMGVNVSRNAAGGIYGNISSGGTTNVTYSPNVTIQGNASRADVEGALKMSMSEFKRMLQKAQADKARVSFG